MPSRYVIRSFSENSYYHIFNRGVEKRQIFQENQDYQIFKYYLFIYLQPIKSVLTKYPSLPLRLQAKNLNTELDLISYCLMPNHFHLLLKQVSIDTISKFLKQITNAYTEYFNKKYQRTGALMEGRFKSVLINSDNLLIHTSRYIHLNPFTANLVRNLKNYQWSSYPEYLNDTENNLCKKKIILDQFPSHSQYEQFVLNQANYAKELEKIKHLTID